MGDKTRIEWTDATSYAGRDFTEVRTHADRLDQPLHLMRSRKIFVNSMSDLFHEDVPFEFIDRVFAVMALAKQHVFQVLTKRPERMREYMHRLGRSAKLLDDAARALGYTFEFAGKYMVAWPLPNIWLGVSAEDQATYDERIELLRQTPAAVRWVSIEPMIGQIDADLGNIDWIVVGGESGPKARPTHPHWVRSLRDQCVVAGVPFLFKQWGEWFPVEHDPFETTRVIQKHGPSVRCFSWSDGQTAIRIGKKAAGRLLDGVLHDGYPLAL